MLTQGSAPLSELNLQPQRLLQTILIDGKYSPSPRELVEIFKKLDLTNWFKQAKLISSDSSRNQLRFSLPNTESSHMLALALMADGLENGLFAQGPSDSFFDDRLLESFRIDGAQFAFSEKRIDDGIEATVQLNYSKDYEGRIDKYTESVQRVISRVMPHLSNETADFAFKVN